MLNACLQFVSLKAMLVCMLYLSDFSFSKTEIKSHDFIFVTFIITGKKWDNKYSALVFTCGCVTVFYLSLERIVMKLNVLIKIKFIFMKYAKEEKL